MLAGLAFGCAAANATAYDFNGDGRTEVVAEFWNEGEPQLVMLAGATVSMESVDQSVSATGQTDAEGRFAVGTLKPGEGVPPGTYRAVVQPPMGADPDQPAPMPFDPKYTRYETSGLEFEITGATDSLAIQLQ